MRAHFDGWGTQGEMLLSIADLPHTVKVSEVLSSMMGHGAFPHADVGLTPPADDPEILQALHCMQAHGFAEQAANQDTWQLTSSGATSIKYAWQLGPSFRAFDVRPGVEMLELTTWEVMCQLEEQGWVWQPLSDVRGDQRAHRLGDALVWYTSGHSVCHQYLLCLLDRERVFQTLPCIPHGARAVVYKSIWEGTHYQTNVRIPGGKAPPTHWVWVMAGAAVEGISVWEAHALHIPSVTVASPPGVRICF